jgi:hypothetical protein
MAKSEPKRPASVPESATWSPADDEWELGEKKGRRSVGAWKWWRPDGSLVATSSYDDEGNLHGVCTRFHPDGDVSMRIEYVHGTERGKKIHTRSKGGDSPEDLHLEADGLPEGLARLEMFYDDDGDVAPAFTYYGALGHAPIAAGEPLGASLGKLLAETAFVVPDGTLTDVDGRAIDVAPGTVVKYAGLARGGHGVRVHGGAHVVSADEIARACVLAVDALAAGTLAAADLEAEDHDDTEDDAVDAPPWRQFARGVFPFDDATPATSLVTLGEVRLPSGNLLVLDMGLLDGWSHQKTHAFDPDLGMSGQRFVDLVVAGPDAAKGTPLLHGDGEEEPTIGLYDVPARAVLPAQRTFEERAAASGVNAKLEIAAERVPHGERVRQVLAQGTFGDVPFSIGNAIALAGLPKGKTIRVAAEPGVIDGTWASVSLVLSNALPTEREQIGNVVVERARILLTDPDALAEWKHEEAIDGKADVVFWGLHAQRLAHELGADSLPDGNFGWLDLPLARIPKDRLERLVAAEEEGGLRAELRPHSHHHAVLKEARLPPKHAGMLDLAGGKMLAFLTHGDGVFPVYRELDDGGALVRVTVVLESDEDDGEEVGDEDEDGDGD